MSDLQRRLASLAPEQRALLESRLLGSQNIIPARNQIPRRTILTPCPASFAQQRLWFLAQLEPDSPAYILRHAMRVRGALDVAALRETLDATVGRHEALRTTFVSEGGVPLQVIADRWALDLPIVDLTAPPGAERDAEMQRLLHGEARRPFDLSRDLMLRAMLLRASHDDHVLLLTLHHIAADGWSMRVLWKEMSALYAAFAAGRRPTLPALPVQYADFAVWQREALSETTLRSQLEYWQRQLAGIPASLDLPLDRPRPRVQSYRGQRHGLLLPRPLSDALLALGRREGATLFMLLLAALQALLHRLTGEDDIVVGAPVAGRNRTEIEELIGCFLNTLVLRTDLSGDPSFRELLGRARQVALDAYANQDVPLERILEAVRPERDAGRTAPFQVLLNMQNEAEELRLPGLSCTKILFSENAALFDLTLYYRHQVDGILLTAVSNADLFDDARIAELLAQFRQLLARVVEDPDERLSHISLVTPSARSVLPDPVAGLDVGWKGAVHSAVARQALRTPDRVALVDRDGGWTYGELDARSNQLAHWLREGGVGAEDVVAIYGHRSAPLVWAVLGALKAGAAFLILDPTYPAARLLDCLRMAEPRAWLEIAAAGSPPAELAAFVAAIPRRARLGPGPRAATNVGPPITQYPAGDPGVPVGPDDLACVAFTSGSTGRPKGILGRHGSLSHFLPWFVETFALGEADRFSMLSALSHDPLQRDIFTALWVGGTLCIPDPERMDSPGWLAEWLREEAISATNLTPAMVHFLCGSASRDQAAADPVASLRYAFIVGDALTHRTVARLRALAPNVTAVNLYGTTETQRALGFFVVPRDEAVDPRNPIPLGRGMPDAQLLVMNAAGQLAGVGEPGEIHVRSPHLARGYLNDAELTTARFGRNPFTNDVADRWYRTGDRGRYRPDGTVEFIGRSDRQVKVRGFRVELPELEGVLELHPAIRRAAAMVREDRPGDPRLVAYLVTDGGAALRGHDIRDFLRERLPSYMVPSAFVALDRLPLTPSGKLDRRALPPPAEMPAEAATRPPTTPMEQVVAGIWRDVLGVEQVGVDDNFFDLGGHSLLAMQVLDRLEKATGARRRPRDLFLQTLGQLAAACESETQGATKSGLLRKAFARLRRSLSNRTTGP